ncbi:riboflavin synthase [bacterium]|nr:riboflavin synthase [bacterium]
MFTGIIEEVGKILNTTQKFEAITLTISASKIFDDIKIGDSISVNGVCTTVTSFNSNSFTVDISAQTLNVTNFKNLKNNDFVNLERAMQIGARFGGHIVSGHIDFVSQFLNKKEVGNSIFLTFEISQDKEKYFVDKGSVTINGISLTIAQKQKNAITVCIIPHTLENTNLKYLKIGEFVNIEIDLVAKYIENFTISNDNTSKINENFLKENGFYEI